VPQDTGITAVAHTIQLAVAPVFLLSGVAGILAVLTSRLGRAVDRARVLRGQMTAKPQDDAATILTELDALARRARFISYAIASCTLTALLVCAVIVALFVATFVKVDASVPVALLFVAAMIALCVGLLFFLREIFIATATRQIGPR
jgi:hypothetical protein